MKGPLALSAIILLALAGALSGGGRPAHAQGPVELQPCPVVGIFCATVTVWPKTTPGYTQGEGRVTSSPPGIDCTFRGATRIGTCSLVLSWSASKGLTGFFELYPKAAPGSLGLTGSAGHGVNRGHEYRAEVAFVLTRHDLSVRLSGAGTGKVRSSPPGIDCGGTCTAKFDYGTNVRLTATPDAGAVFRGWTGACGGQGKTCNVKVTGSTSTNAVFEVAPPTTTTSHTTTTAPTTTSTTTTSQRDTSVDADLIAVKAGRSRLGARIVRVELDLSENVSATLTLGRGSQTLATKQSPHLREGTRVVTMVIPAGIAKGSAMLVVELRDTSGNTSSWRRAVRIPSLQQRKVHG